MKDDVQENMVLRTVYLPVELDGRLREVAFSRGVSKGVLIREFVKLGLDAWAAAGERTLADKISARAQAKAASAAKAAAAPVKREAKPAPKRAADKPAGAKTRELEPVG